MYNILIVDDNKVLLNSLSLFLRSEGFNVETTTTAVEGIVKIKAKDWDLVLLDYYLDEMEAPTFLGIIEEFENKPKVAVFTAKTREEIELRSLESGVEDFIRKTENPKILLNRINRILEEKRGIEKLVSTKENVEVNLRFRSVHVNGIEVILTKTEFEILVMFLSNKNKVLTRQNMYETIWQSKNKFLEELRTIDVHVLNLRRKIKGSAIVSRKGMGYVWIEE